MKHIDDGGPAFPLPGNAEWNPCFGMSLRDWFAGQALSGILVTLPDEAWKPTAQHAYRLADAMLGARQPPKKA